MIDVIPVSRLTSHAQVFRCEPYSANITARTCLARQSAVGDSRTGKAPPKYPRCVGCELGGRVAARVEGDDAGAPVGVVCVHEGCAVVLTSLPRGRKVRPLCPDHRSQSPSSGGHEPITKGTPVKNAPKTKPATAEATVPATCTAHGCDSPGAKVRTDSAPETADFCRRDRLIAHQRATDAGVELAVMAEQMRAGTWEAKRGVARVSKATKTRATKKPARKPAKAPKRQAVSPLAGALELVKRDRAVITDLGGIDAAESFVERVRLAGGPDAVVAFFDEVGA